MEKVSVDKRVLMGIVGVGALALLGLVFMLGRASVSAKGNGLASELSGRAGSPPGRGAGERSANSVLPVPSPVEVSPFPPIASLPTIPSPQPSAGRVSKGFSDPIPAPGSASNERGDPARAAVVRYFEAVDAIQPEKMAGSAESAGAELASALANGDTSGLDKLIRDTEAARARLSAVAPPPECAAHHRESLASIDEALEMLRSLKAAMQSSDPAAQLGAITSRAQTLRSRSEALQQEEQSLRERYGLKR